MDNGNVGPGQMMGQWSNFEAPEYNPNQKNVDPLLADDSIEKKIEKKVEQLPDNMNRVNEGGSLSYDKTGVLGGAGLNATDFLGEQEIKEQTPLGEVMTSRVGYWEQIYLKLKISMDWNQNL